MKMTTKKTMTLFAALLLIIGSTKILADVRTDLLISQNIKAKMSADPSLSQAYIDINTTDAVVTLNGMVDTPIQKQTITNIAESMIGVKKVNADIRVRGEEHETHNSPGVPGATGAQGAPGVQGAPGKSGTQTVLVTQPPTTQETSSTPAAQRTNGTQKTQGSEIPRGY